MALSDKEFIEDLKGKLEDFNIVLQHKDTNTATSVDANDFIRAILRLAKIEGLTVDQ